MKNITAAIAGLHTRLDIPTKCRIVEKILTRKFPTKKQQNAFIEGTAKTYGVNSITVKLWCSKYEKTYKQGMKLPSGTMSFAFATIPEQLLPDVVQDLEKLRNNLSNIRRNSQTVVHFGLSLQDVLKTNKPGEILDELITKVN